MASDDVRARRAERVREQKLKDAPKIIAKNAAVGVAALVVLAGLGYVIWYSTAGKPDDVHWHAAWEMYAWDDESQSYRHVQFNNPAYDLNSGSAVASHSSYHLHTAGGGSNSDDVVHLEFKAPPFPVERFLEGVGLRMSKSSVTLDELHGENRYRENDTHKWRLFVQSADGDWAEQRSFEDYRMRDGDRLLVTFGDPDEMDGAGGELETQLASVSRDVPGHSNAERGGDKVGGDGDGNEAGDRAG